LTRNRSLRHPRRMANQVLVFHQVASCGHCREYMPRFRKLALSYKGKLEIRSLDLNRADKSIQDAAQKFKIAGVPTTIVLGENDRVLRRAVGNLPDAQIAKLLALADGK
jgi:thiol-disulfide isomerase/thioredoxin